MVTRDEPRPSCGDLQEVSSDFHALIQAACPLCQGSGPECLVGKMRGMVDDTVADALATTGPRH